MPFTLLKIIIRHFQKKHPCPECGTRFEEQNISILATTPATPDLRIYGLFLAVCTGCLGIIPVTVEVGTDRQKRKKASIQFHPYSMPGEKISTDEVLDMKNFLRNWKGHDVQRLFKNP